MTRTEAAMDSRDPNESDERLLEQDQYTVEQLAKLLDMDHQLIERAVFNGELKAQIVEHHIVSISRADVIDWLRAGV